MSFLYNSTVIKRFLRYRPFIRPVKSIKKSSQPSRDTLQSLSLPQKSIESPKLPILPKSPAISRIVSSPYQGVKLLQAFHTDIDIPSKISASLEIAVDVKKQSIRGLIQLPHGIKQESKLLVFCPDNDAADIIGAGADYAGLTDIIARIQKGWLGFDRVLASPNVMPQILKIAKILGPLKLMPNPKSGTILENLKQGIQEIKGGARTEFRAEMINDHSAIINVIIGVTNFNDSFILDNLKYLIREISKFKPKNSTNSTSISSINNNDENPFILNAKIQTENGPPIYLDTEKLHPTSSGYFR
jgi:large subunit ribosomal protein L1